MSFIFGKGPKAAEPFRAPGFEQQGEILNQLFTGRIFQTNPQLLAGAQPQFQQPQFQQQQVQQFLPSQGTALPGFGGQIPGTNRFSFAPPPDVGQGAVQGIPGFTRFSTQGLPPESLASPFPFPQFGRRDPFAFGTDFNAAQAVGDAFTPQAERLRNIFGDVAQERLSQFDEDINRRGLFTSGAALEGRENIQQRIDDQLANSLLGLQDNRQDNN